jgi:hypothetical protein
MHNIAFSLRLQIGVLKFRGVSVLYSSRREKGMRGDWESGSASDCHSQYRGLVVTLSIDGLSTKNSL